VRSSSNVKARSQLHIVVTDGRGRTLSIPGLSRWLIRVAPASACGEVVIALVSNTKMRMLNKRFRGQSRVTDVLSFSVDSSGQPYIGSLRQLGDVVIAKDVAMRQARSAGHAFHVELRRLALHGLLHLLGYDHEKDNGRMLRLERRLLRKGGIRDVQK